MAKAKWVEEMEQEEKATTRRKKAEDKKAPRKARKTVTTTKDKVAKKKPVQRKIAHKKRAVTVEQKEDKPKDVAEVKPSATTTEAGKTISPSGIQRLADHIEMRVKDSIKDYVNRLVASSVVPGSMEIPIYQRSQPSVELKRDSKGAFSYTIKAYADTLKEALEQVSKINNDLVEALDE